jgi:hypothetical protein
VWRRWYVRVPDSTDDGLAAFRAAMPSGVWLEGSDLRTYHLRRVLPVLPAAIGFGGLMIVAALWMLRWQ